MKLKLLFSSAYCLLMHMAYAQPQHYVTKSGTNTQTIPINNASNNKAQTLMLNSYFPFASSGNITALYFRVSGTVGNTYTIPGWSISLGQTSLTALSIASGYMTGLTNVYPATSTLVTVMAGNWIKVNLVTPYAYDNTKNLVIEMTTTATSGINQYYTTTVTGATIFGLASSSTPSSSTTIIPDFGFDMAVAPTKLADNAAMLSIASPIAGTFCPIFQNFTVRFANLGSSRINGLKLSWLVDGVKQPDLQYNTLLDTFSGLNTNAISFTLGSIDFSKGLPRTVQVYTSMPNGNADGNTANDTITGTFTPVAPVAITPGSATSICPGSAVNVVLTPTAGGTSYTWRYTAPGSTSQFTVQVGPTAAPYTATAFGTYTVNTTLGSCNTTGTIKIDSFKLPDMLIKPGPIACLGATLHTDTAFKGGIFQWYLNGIPIPGATADTFLPTQAGAYKVFCDRGDGCTDSAVVIVKQVVGIPTISGTSHVLITDTTGITSYQWYVMPEGSTTQIKLANDTMYYCNPKQKGNYTVVVFNGGCSATSHPYTVDSAFLGVNMVYSAATVRIYPNPASNVLHVDAPVNTKISIMGMDGRIVLQQATENTIDISQLPGALYIIRITDKNGALIRMEKFTKLQ